MLSSLPTAKIRYFLIYALIPLIIARRADAREGKCTEFSLQRTNTEILNYLYTL